MKTDFLSDLVINNVICATTLSNEKNTSGIRTERSQWAVIIKYEGETRYISDGKEYISDVNNIMLLPRGSNYEWKCTKSGHFITVEFECDFSYNGIFSFNAKNSSKIMDILRRIEYRTAMKNRLSRLENIRDLYSVIFMLRSSEEKKYTPDSKKQKLLPAIEYIARNYNSQIRNDTLAKLVDMSTVYFRKLFFEVYGISPIAYVHRLRINKAEEILRTDYGSITDIAYSLGYSSIYDFSRDFKKHTGFSPKEFAGKYK